MTKLEKYYKKIDKEFNRMCDKLNKRFDDSYEDVLTAFSLESTCGTDKAFLASKYNCSMAKINPENGKPHDILMYFPDYTLIEQTRYFLDVYLTTNRDVLDADVISTLEALIERYK